MSLTLYLHPLASFCHKVLIALYESGRPFAPVTVNLGEPGAAAQHLARWPIGKIPVLADAAAGRLLPETSIIIEYLERHYPGPAPLLPADAEERLQVRLWDRFFDLYVSVPVQKIVGDRIRPESGRDPYGVAEAHRTLDTAYGMIEEQMATATWAAGPSFSMADCAAAPALFFASIVHPVEARHVQLARYLDRLLDRPSVRRTLAEAQPYFSMFPYRDAMPERYVALR
jgi:glutathione S-transferase